MEEQRKKFEKVLDSKGNPITGFLRHVPTGHIHIRKTFKRLGLPTLNATTKEKTLGRARAVAELLEQRHKNKHLGIDDTGIWGRLGGKRLTEVIDEVLRDYTPEWRPMTQAKHRLYFEDIRRGLGHVHMNFLTEEVFKDWLRKRAKQPTLRGKDRHPTTCRKTFHDFSKHMNILMRWAYNKKYVTHCIQFKNPDKGKAHEDRVYTDAEISAMWEHMNEETRDQFVLSYECFMRLREVLRLTWDRVDLETGIVTLRKEDVKTGSRTGKGRDFVVSSHALERLRCRRREISTSPYVFPSPANSLQPIFDNKTAWRIVKENAGIKGRATWHALRHTALTKALLEKRMDPIAVSEYAGVSLKTIQRVYLHSKAHDTRDVSGAVKIEVKK